MRSRSLLGLIFLFSLACDKDEKAKALASKVEGDATTPSVVDAGARAAVDSGPAAPASVAMPERPVARPQNTVAMTMPEEVQMKAITYMAAMRSPHPGDPNADPQYAADLATKLKPVLLGADKGSDKAKWNRIEVVASGRQIDLMMSAGCDQDTPKHVVTGGAGVQLTTLYQHGVLVVRCNDVKIQCLQSTRDQDDVLCTTAPRHK